MGRRGAGHIYKAFHAWHVRYYATEMVNGVATRVQKSHRLCDAKNHTKTEASDLAHDFLRGIKQAAPVTTDDVTVRAFWEHQYLPYCEKEWKGKGMRPSSVRGFKQIWKQHLEPHFGAAVMLRAYTAKQARRFLSSLKTKQGHNTLRHVRALSSAMFAEAVERDLIDANPWRGVKLPKDCKDPKPTGWYTLQEAEDIISALVDHADCQLIMALSCFLGLRPGEIAALKIGDFDTGYVHVRRSVVRGIVGEPKTQESIRSIPLIDAVRVPLELWRRKCGRTEGWLFESRNGTPVDLHNVIRRVIVPHVEGSRPCVLCDRTPKASGVVWKSMYSGRRGAITAIIEATNGNYAIAQAAAGHKRMTTTLNVYKKAITPEGFADGMKQYERKMLKG